MIALVIALVLGITANYAFLMYVLTWQRRSAINQQRQMDHFMQQSTQVVSHTVEQTVGAVTSQLFGPAAVTQHNLSPEMETIASQEWFQEPADETLDPATFLEPDPISMRQKSMSIRPGDLSSPQPPDSSAETL